MVFAQVPDPVGLGMVESLSRPGGNITGFALFEYAIGLKWLELLKQIAPHVSRVAILYDPEQPTSPSLNFRSMRERARRRERLSIKRSASGRMTRWPNTCWRR